MTRKYNPYEDMDSLYEKPRESDKTFSPSTDWNPLDIPYCTEWEMELIYQYCLCPKPDPVNLSLFRATWACKRCGRDIKGDEDET